MKKFLKYLSTFLTITLLFVGTALASPTFVKTATIASGASLSGAITFDGSSDDKGYNLPTGSRLFGIIMPAAWTAANLTFQASHDGGATWHNVKDADANEITITVDQAGDWIALIPDALAAITNLKIRSGTTSAPVNQAADRTLTLVLRSK